MDAEKPLLALGHSCSKRGGQAPTASELVHCREELVVGLEVSSNKVEAAEALPRGPPSAAKNSEDPPGIWFGR